jgi:hypothetical protein
MTLHLHQPLSHPSSMRMVFSLVAVAALAPPLVNCSQWYSRALAEERFTHELDRQRERAVEGNALKRIILDRFLCREITLEDAAGSFLEVDSGRPLVLAHVRTCYGGRDDLEREARSVAHLSRLKARAVAVPVMPVDRLVEEFRRVFPESPPPDAAALDGPPRTDGW